MKKSRIYILLAFMGIAGILGFYAKKKILDPKNKIETANRETIALTDNNEIKSGDLIFQTSLSGQSKAIQLATHSKYSHCGIIYKEGNDYSVFEAVEPVKSTALAKWIARGQDGHFVIKRLKNAQQVLTPEVLEKMQRVSEHYKGKHYDIYFEWSDDKIYCSELIWKIYQRATGIEIGKLQELREFDLTSEAVKQKMKERYGSKVPMDEKVISPASIFDSEILTTVKEN